MSTPCFSRFSRHPTGSNVRPTLRIFASSLTRPAVPGQDVRACSRSTRAGPLSGENGNATPSRGCREHAVESGQGSLLMNGDVQDAAVRELQAAGCPQLGEPQWLVSVRRRDLYACRSQVVPHRGSAADPDTSDQYLSQGQCVDEQCAHRGVQQNGCLTSASRPAGASRASRWYTQPTSRGGSVPACQTGSARVGR